MSERPHERPEFSLSGSQLVDYLNYWSERLTNEQDELTQRILEQPSLVRDEVVKGKWHKNAGKIEMLLEIQKDLSESSIDHEMLKPEIKLELESFLRSIQDENPGQFE